MRKTSEEFNCPEAIENVKTICGNDHLEQLPHWSTINAFLERLNPSQLEKIIPKLVSRLLRMRSFEDSKVRGKYWQILIDGTQLYNDTEQLDERCLTKTHRNKEDGSLRYVESEEIIKLESHAEVGKTEGGKATYHCDYVKGIDYKGLLINVVKYEQSNKEYPYVFITDLSVTEKNQMNLVNDGRRRWRIENEGFNTQKCHVYALEHQFSKDYNGMKNHYYLIQIAHMIAQLIENWKKLWENTRISQGEKHRKLLESFKKDLLKEIYVEETQEIQIRFI